MSQKKWYVFYIITTGVIRSLTKSRSRSNYVLFGIKDKNIEFYTNTYILCYTKTALVFLHYFKLEVRIFMCVP